MTFGIDILTYNSAFTCKLLVQLELVLATEVVETQTFRLSL